MKQDSELTFYDAFVDYYTNDIDHALLQYDKQYSDSQWSPMVNNTLANSHEAGWL